MWIAITIALLVAMPVVHGLGHYVAAGRPGRLVHALIPFYHCAGSGLFHDLTLERRVLSLATGLTAHYVALAGLVLMANLMWGMPTGTSHILVKDVLEDTDAHAQLRPGDRLVSANGHRLGIGPDRTMALSALVQDEDGDPVSFVVERDGEQSTVSVTPFDERGIWRLGVTMDFVRDVEYQGAVANAAAFPARRSWALADDFLQALVGEEEAELTGPVGITVAVELAETPRIAFDMAIALALLEAMLFVLVDLVLLGFAIVRR